MYIVDGVIKRKGIDGMASENNTLAVLTDKKRPFSIAEAKAFGISAQMLAYYCKCGRIERIYRGVYAPRETEVNPYPELEQLIKKGSEFVVCLLSALQIHEFTTQLPHTLWIAVPHGGRLPTVDTGRLTAVRLTGHPYHFGVEEKKLYGMNVKIYSPAKTVADCFKFRNKIGVDVALEALKDGYRQKLFTASELWRAAKVCRVSEIIRPYQELLES
jgi:predicted transcriptional regulator of viral defense system